MSNKGGLFYFCDGHVCKNVPESERGCIKYPGGYCMRTHDKNHALHNQSGFPDTCYGNWFSDDIVVEKLLKYKHEDDDSKTGEIIREWQLKIDGDNMIASWDEFANTTAEESTETEYDRCNRLIESYTEKVRNLSDMLSNEYEKGMSLRLQKPRPDNYDSETDIIEENIHNLARVKNDCSAILCSLLAYQKILTADDMRQYIIDELNQTTNHIQQFLCEMADDNTNAIRRLTE